MVDELIRHRDRYYIPADSSRVDDRTRVLKDGDSFALFDRHGEIGAIGSRQQGLYHRGTRHLSRLELRVGGRRCLLLGSAVREDNLLLSVDLANPALPDSGLAADTIHLRLELLLFECVLHVRLNVHSFAEDDALFPLQMHFDADFADIFEVRGMSRQRRGARRPTICRADEATLRYQGLDGRQRSTRLHCVPAPARIAETTVEWQLRLAPGEDTELGLEIGCEQDSAPIARGWERAAAEASAGHVRLAAQEARLHSSNEQFNDWWNRSTADLRMMLTELPEGSYPYAGVPWFSTVFGRDGIITALECLWVNPLIARGVLIHLAAHQAVELDPERDAEPGKILHETRDGEMAALGEIPFGRYYGSVDATPLFVVLAEAYFRHTGDIGLIRDIRPQIRAALKWIEDYGDVDGDGFVEYRQRGQQGLANQGWKDSTGSVFHADGRAADGPIALCEVQAYVYAAWRAAAALDEVLGDRADADACRDRAEKLRARFEPAFWQDDLDTYALALDGDKRPCRVRSSNAGHVLWSGLASPEHAVRVADTLLSGTGFSDWGVRTLAEGEACYNPMSYHNGSVWPHDNALIAAGFARYGLKRAALRVLTALFDASLFLDLHRLPELYCGFTRRPGEGPTLYPVACAPQAWAVASVFLLLQAALGLSIDASERRLVFEKPRLPPWLLNLHIENLRVGTAVADLAISRRDRQISAQLVHRTGDIELVIRP